MNKNPIPQNEKDKKDLKGLLFFWFKKPAVSGSVVVIMLLLIVLLVSSTNPSASSSSSMSQSSTTPITSSTNPISSTSSSSATIESSSISASSSATPSSSPSSIAQFIVTFNAMGGTAIASQTVNQGAFISTITPPTKTGYSFAGWFLSTDGGTTLTTEWNLATNPVTENITLYAKWTINLYTINFEMNGASPIESIVAEYQATITPPSRPARLDYRFGGWFADALFNTTFIFPTNMPANNLTVYVKWINSIKPLDIQMGNKFAVGLSEDGALYAWGFNDFRQLGNNTSTEEPNPIPIIVSGLFPEEKFVQISVSNDQAMALTNEGRVFAWGRSQNLRLGFFSSANISTPTIVNFSQLLDPQEKITQIRLRDSGGFAITSAGNKLIGWGSNGEYRLGIAEEFNDTLPIVIPLGLVGNETIRQFITGQNHNLVLTSENRILGWGGNSTGQLGRPNATWTINEPTDLTATIPLETNEIVRLMITSNDVRSTMLVTNQDRILVAGNNTQGLLGTGNTTAVNTFTPINIPALNPNETIVLGSMTTSFTNLVTSENRLIVSGRNNLGQLGLPSSTTGTTTMLINNRVPLLMGEAIKSITLQTGSDTLGTAIITTSLGRSFGWGDLRYARLGNSAITGSSLFDPTLLEI